MCDVENDEDTQSRVKHFDGPFGLKQVRLTRSEKGKFGALGFSCQCE